MITKQLVVRTENPPKVEGIEWQILKGHSISQQFYLSDKVSAKIENAYWRLIAEECGGGATNTGSANIICDDNGLPLKAFRTPRRGHLACGTHALFTCRSCIQVHADHHRRDFNIEITKYEIDTKGKVKIEHLWNLGSSGPADASYSEVLASIPKRFEKFESAIKAAMDKATSYHCRSVFYAQ